MSTALALEQFADAAPESIPDQLLRDVFTAAVKIYAAKVESAAGAVPALDKNAVTATEAVIAICELMRAADLNPFDVAMWYRRPLPEFPGEAR